MGIKTSLLGGLNLATLIFMLAFSIDSVADEFSLMDDNQKLTDKTIFASGNIMQLFGQEPSGDLINSNYHIFMLGQYCFTSPENLARKAGLLLIDNYSTIYIATFSSSMSSIETHVTLTSLVDCIQAVKQNSDERQQKLDELIKKNQSMIDLLKKQKKSLK